MVQPHKSTEKRLGKQYRSSVISDQEWDFRSCPEAEVHFCYYYEFARSCPEIVEAISGLVPTQAHHGHVPDRYFSDPAFKQLCDGLVFLRQFSEFPLKPWLQISNETRSRKTRHLAIPVRPGSRERLPVSALPFIDAEGKRIPAGETNLDYPYSRFKTDHTIWVDWRLTDTQLRKHFVAWLKANRSDRVPNEVRGLTMRAEFLRGLGAYRLLNNFQTAAQVMVYLARRSSDNLFQDTDALYRARRMAHQHLVSAFLAEH